MFFRALKTQDTYQAQFKSGTFSILSPNPTRKVLQLHGHFILVFYRNTPIKEPDYLATIDMDENSPTFCQVCHVTRCTIQ